MGIIHDWKFKSMKSMKFFFSLPFIEVQKDTISFIDLGVSFIIEAKREWQWVLNTANFNIKKFKVEWNESVIRILLFISKRNKNERSSGRSKNNLLIVYQKVLQNQS